MNKTACDPCKAGQTDLEDATLPAGKACVFCAAGKVPPSDQSGPCIGCVAGRYDNDHSPITACVVCKGATWSAAAAIQCTACGNGKYLDNNADQPEDHDAEADCVACVAGRADTDHNASTACEACPAGTFNDGTEAETPRSCESCPAGQYSASGATACISCGAGFFAADRAATVCLPCAAGRTDENSGAATSCESCPAMQYSAVQSFGECTPCFENSKSGEGADMCQCKDGFLLNTTVTAVPNCDDIVRTNRYSCMIGD